MILNSDGKDRNSSRWESKNHRQPNGNYLAPYRRIAHQLHHDLRLSGSRSVLLASPSDSPLCANGGITLAASLTEELHRSVLLIDACPRTREISRMLECEEAPGFTDFLADPAAPLETLALNTSIENVWFLPAGTHRGKTPGPPDAIESLVKAAGDRYEFTVWCAGPVLHDSMALAVAPHAGCVLLLVIENETTVEDLDAAQDALNFCHARKVGLVLTTAAREGIWTRNSGAPR